MDSDIKMASKDTEQRRSLLETEQQDNVNSPQRLLAEKQLRYWNTAMMILHLIQGIMVLAVGTSVDQLKSFVLPLSTYFTVWPNGYPQQEIQDRGELPFVAVTSGFAFLSSGAHLIVLLFFQKYLDDLRKGRNLFRWYEYALSSSLMIGLIAMLFGMYDIISLVLLMGLNAMMNLFGLLFETINYGRKKEDLDWTPFWYGCISGALPWCAVLAYLGGSKAENIPGFVWGIFFVYLFFFNLFPINMYLQYKQIGRWGDEKAGFVGGGYLYGEKMYQILSLLAKSFLLWLVVGGANQPTATDAPMPMFPPMMPQCPPCNTTGM